MPTSPLSRAIAFSTSVPALSGRRHVRAACRVHALGCLITRLRPHSGSLSARGRWAGTRGRVCIAQWEDPAGAKRRQGHTPVRLKFSADDPEREDLSERLARPRPGRDSHLRPRARAWPPTARSWACRLRARTLGTLVRRDHRTDQGTDPRRLGLGDPAADQGPTHRLLEPLLGHGRGPQRSSARPRPTMHTANRTNRQDSQETEATLWRRDRVGRRLCSPR